MRLLDSLLLDPHKLDVWIALRTDGVKGSGTESDPYDASPRKESALSITGIAYSGREATVTTTSAHPYNDGNVVMIEGVTGAGAGQFNGRFSIYGKTGTTFKYAMIQQPSGSPMLTDAKCAKVVFQFDELMFPGFPEYTAIHLGPEVFETRGMSQAIGGWFCNSGWKFIGSGIDVTTLKIVHGYGAEIGTIVHCLAIGTYIDNNIVDFEASDFTVDCNLSGQPIPADKDFAPVACGAIRVGGSRNRVRRIRAINFGTQTADVECFVISLAAGKPGAPEPEPYDCVIEDCLAEQPSRNNVQLTTVLQMAAFEDAAGIMGYHRACVMRNNLVDCEYKDNPAPIVSITINTGTGVATVTTRVPHGRVNNDWVVISGALENGLPNTTYNGSYQISNVTSTMFTYTPVSYSGLPVPTTNAAGDMWVDRFSSHFVAAATLERLDADPGDIATLTTLTPHNRKLANNVLVNNAGVLTGVNYYNGGFPITQIVWPVKLKYRMNGIPADKNPTGSIIVGAFFQALSNDAGTAAVVEGNRIFNCLVGGPYHDTFNTRDLIIRNNHYRSVDIGPYQQMGLNSPPKPGSSLVRNGTTATFTTATAHGLTVGQQVTISGAVVNNSYTNPYNGTFNVASVPTSTSFTYVMSSDPGANAAGSPVFGTLLSVSSLVRDGADPTIAVLTTSSAHGFVAGDFVSVFGATVGGSIATFYNGAFVILSDPAPTSTTFAYRMRADPDATAGGTPQCARAVGSPMVSSGSTATFTTVLPHGLVARQGVIISGATGVYDGPVEVVSVPSSTSFTYQMTGSPGANAAPPASFGALWQTGRLVIEGNLIELIQNIHPNGYGNPRGIDLTSRDFGSVYVFREVVIRNNVIRHLDDGSDTSQWPVAMRLFSCENAIVEDNVINLSTANPIRHFFSKSVKFFNNRAPDGRLIQGAEFDQSEALIGRDDELETNIEDATLISL